MKHLYILCLTLIVLCSGCRIFKPGCHCPKVSYSAHPAHKGVKNS
jgi:hypothetical protein